MKTMHSLSEPSVPHVNSESDTSQQQPQGRTAPSQRKISASNKARLKRGPRKQNFLGTDRGMSLPAKKSSAELAWLNSLQPDEPLPENLRLHLQNLSDDQLNDLIAHLAAHAFPNNSKEARQPAQNWAADFLSIKASSPDAFFERALKCTLARTRVGRNLTLAAAALALRMLAKDAKAAVPGSLHYDLQYHYTLEQSEAYIQGCAVQAVHSSHVENVEMNYQTTHKALRDKMHMPEVPPRASYSSRKQRERAPAPVLG